MLQIIQTVLLRFLPLFLAIAFICFDECISYIALTKWKFVALIRRMVALAIDLSVYLFGNWLNLCVINMFSLIVLVMCESKTA